jgi:hypothetical protein
MCISPFVSSFAGLVAAGRAYAFCAMRHTLARIANCCATAWEDRLQPRTDATVQSTVTGGRLSDLVTYDAVTVPIDWYNYDS